MINNAIMTGIGGRGPGMQKRNGGDGNPSPRTGRIDFIETIENKSK